MTSVNLPENYDLNMHYSQTILPTCGGKDRIKWVHWQIFGWHVISWQNLNSGILPIWHGKNSGGNYATSFSNENGSHKSSLGFYLTENTYQGRNGYSLILNGLEKGINDLAKQRAIVIHGASYSDPSVAASSGRLGRSFGCPALPVSVSNIEIAEINFARLQSI